MPLGTIIRNLEQEIICDLSKEGSMFLAAKGGSGGKGNTSFKGHYEYKFHQHDNKIEILNQLKVSSFFE